MARPPKNFNSIPKNQEIEATFWKLLHKKSLSKITVSELIKESHCNRTTFYYYFTDINDLANQMIRKTIPEHLPYIAKLYLSGSVETRTFDTPTKNAIEMICLLIRGENTTNLQRIIENAIVDLWISQFDLKIPIPEEIRCTLEFLAGGIVSLLSRYAYPQEQNQLQTGFIQANRLFSGQAIQYLESCKNL